VDSFPSDLADQVEELNRAFTRHYANGQPITTADEEFVTVNSNRSLDDWYWKINRIYVNRNFHTLPVAVFSHLVEVVGGLSLLASEKNRPGTRPELFIPKAVAWWLALCGKAGVKSVEDMVWAKFPGVCTYCLKVPHVSQECSEHKAARNGPDWERLDKIARDNISGRPRTLGEWQRMFAGIYLIQSTEPYGTVFARLSEELGELAEALRVFPAAPGYFLSEATDVFAWLMHLQILIELKNKVPSKDAGHHIQRAFCITYPDRCVDCNLERCACPPILASTIGRIAHEVPPVKGSFSDAGSFLTSEKMARKLLFD
jgi:NTP pyrophosphatase (non-canonical NTP hydrolase)